jgi:gliding motility-associated-like protein
LNRLIISRICFFLIVILFFPFNILFAQVPAVYWQKCFGGTASDVRALVRGTSDHGSIIGGFGSSSDGDIHSNAGAQDIAILKLDVCGNKQWTKIIGGGSLDLLYGLAEIPGNGYYFAGSTGSSSVFSPYHGGSMDALIGRLDVSGNLIWIKTFGGSSSEILSSIVVLPDTSCVIAGWTNSPDGDGGVSSAVQNAWLVKVDKNGNLVWKKVFGGNFATAFFDISLSNDGGFIMAGHLVVPPGISNSDFYLVKTDASGNLIWQKQYGGGQGDNARTVRACSGGGYIAAGNTASTGGDVSGFQGLRDAWIIRVDESGNLLWQKCIGGSQSEEIWEMMASSNDRYWFAGNTGSTDGDITQSMGAGDAMVIEMNGTGNMQDLKTFGGTSFDTFFGISSASDGSVFLSGNSGSNDGDIQGNHGTSDFILFKLKNKLLDDKDTSSCQPFLFNNVWVVKDTSITSLIKDQCNVDSALLTWHVTLSTMGFVQSIPDVTINAGESIQLTTTASGPVEWTGPGLSCTNCLNPVVQPVVESTYVVSTREGDCKISDTIIIRINHSDSLYIPTAFTPNGDGLNDVFKAIGTAKEYSMKVFNRWGNLVFQSNSVMQGWNGQIGGKMQASGVYVYYVRYRKNSGHMVQSQGTVLLVR